MLGAAIHGTLDVSVARLAPAETESLKKGQTRRVGFDATRGKLRSPVAPAAARPHFRPVQYLRCEDGRIGALGSVDLEVNCTPFTKWVQQCEGKQSVCLAP